MLRRKIVAICWLMAGGIAGGLAGRANAEEPSKPVSYSREIRPIFQAQCHGCHQPAKKGGGYVMTTHEGLMHGGESGEAAIVAGEPTRSALLGQITPVNNEAAMPKGKSPLSPAQIELVQRWIAEGAKDDSPASTRPQFDMEHPPVYPAPPVITSLDFSPDGELLAVSGYHEVLLLKSDGSGTVARLVGLAERIESAVFSPDGRLLAVSGGSPARMGELQIWDVAEKSLKFSVTIGYDTLYGASWSPNQKLIACGCPDNTVRAFDVESGKQLFFNGAHNDWVLDTTFSVNSDHLISVSRDMSMKLFHLETQRFIDNVTSITPGALKGGLNSITRHPARDELLVGGADGAPKIFKMVRDKARQIGDNSNQIREFSALPGRIYSVAYSRDGNRIVAGSSLDGKGEVRVYDANDGKQLMRAEVATGGIYSVAFRPDGTQVAAAGFDGQVRFYQVSDGSLIKEFLPIPIETAKVAGTDPPAAAVVGPVR
ncbi:MAG: hypothetical protein FJ295_18505 [Planctomycetes bacterium]|nr:hypothetical protein [Planctomycetota bacterium]